MKGGVIDRIGCERKQERAGREWSEKESTSVVVIDLQNVFHVALCLQN